MSKEIEQAVEAYLQEIGVTYSVTGGHETTRDNDWKCDEWRVQFRRPGRQDLVEQYYTGTGHRKLTKMAERELLQYYAKTTPRRRQAFIDANSKPVAPTATGPLYSLLRDAESAEQNFHDWARDFGYDTDSIKARNVYDACCVVLVKLRGFFSHAERTKLMELMEDY